MRRVSEDERRIFEEDFRAARPIKPKPAPRLRGQSGGGGGLDGNTQDRLDRGLITPEARLDLHGLTQAVAHRALGAFVLAARGRGLRLLLIVTGKGNARSPDAALWTESPHGVLKEMTPRWLAEPGLASAIARVQPAHLRHGGGGALYVYLRKLR